MIRGEDIDRKSHIDDSDVLLTDGNDNELFVKDIDIPRPFPHCFILQLSVVTHEALVEKRIENMEMTQIVNLLQVPARTYRHQWLYIFQ